MKFFEKIYKMKFGNNMSPVGFIEGIHLTIHSFLWSLTNKWPEELSEENMNIVFQKKCEMILNKFWPDLTMKERMDIVRCSGMDVVASYNKGMIEVGDIVDLKERVRKFNLKRV